MVIFNNICNAKKNSKFIRKFLIKYLNSICFILKLNLTSMVDQNLKVIHFLSVMTNKKKDLHP